MIFLLHLLMSTVFGQSCHDGAVLHFKELVTLTWTSKESGFSIVALGI